MSALVWHQVKREPIVKEADSVLGSRLLILLFEEYGHHRKRHYLIYVFPTLILRKQYWQRLSKTQEEEISDVMRG